MRLSLSRVFRQLQTALVAQYLQSIPHQELKDLDSQDAASLKADCRNLGLPVEHLRLQDSRALKS